MYRLRAPLPPPLTSIQILSLPRISTDKQDLHPQLEMTKTSIYGRGASPKRPTNRKGRRCRVIIRGKMSLALLEIDGTSVFGRGAFLGACSESWQATE